MGELLINALLVGCGAVGAGYDLKADSPESALSHAGAYRQVKGVRLLACVEPNPARCQEMLDKFDIEYCFATLEEFLKAGISVDVLSICTPSDLHEQILDVAFSGIVRAVVCEKPICHNPNISTQFVEKAKLGGIPFAVNYFRLWDENVLMLARRYKDGEFGALQAGQAGYVKGVMHNGTHLLTLLSEILGQVDVSVILAEENARAGRGADFVLYPCDNPSAEIQVCALDADRYNYFELTLFFEKAVIHFEDGGRRIRLRHVCEHELYKGVMYPEKEEVLASEQGAALPRMIEELVICAKTGRDFRRNAEWCLEAEKLSYKIAGMKRGKV